YARSGFQSVHNRNYWQLGNYIGLGAGAHSFVFPHRYINANHAGDYAAAISIDRLFRRLSDPESQEMFVLENLQMALRLAEGVDIRLFSQKFKCDLADLYSNQIRNLKSAGLLEDIPNALRLTPAGRLRVDSIVQYLM